MTTVNNVYELAILCLKLEPGNSLLCEWPYCLTQNDVFEIFHRLNTELDGTHTGVVVRSAGELLEVVKYASSS